MKQIGRYEIIEELGQGAMGAVYKARDPMMDRVVAVKTILGSALTGPLASDYRERFFREARAAGRLAHPGIVTVYDVAEQEGTPFLVMEYIEGRTLETMLETGERFDAHRVMEFGQQLAEALDYAHKGGVIHRDIKPANIMVTADGRPKITDFGVAKLTAAQMTTTGQLLGTPAFMAPEQFTGAPIDGRADLFALGVMLYWLATGDRPFTGETLMAMSYKIVHTEPVPPRKLNPAVPRDLENVILKCMEKDPAARYQSGEVLARDLCAMREGRALDTLNRERMERDTQKTALAGEPPAETTGEHAGMDTAETLAAIQPRERTASGATAGARGTATTPSAPQATVAAAQRTVRTPAPEVEHAGRRLWLWFAAVMVIALLVAAVLVKQNRPPTRAPQEQTQQQAQPQHQPGGSTANVEVPAPPVPVPAPPAGKGEPPAIERLTPEASKAAKEVEKRKAKVVAEATKHAAPAKAGQGLQLVIKATGGAGVVVQPDDEAAASYQLRPGNEATVEGKKEIKLITSNGGALQLKLNGKELAPLAPNGTPTSVKITEAGVETLWAGDAAALAKRFGKMQMPPAGPAGSDAAGRTGARATPPDLSRLKREIQQQLKATLARLRIVARGIPATLDLVVHMDGEIFYRRDAAQAGPGTPERGAPAPTLEEKFVPPGPHKFQVFIGRAALRTGATQNVSGEFTTGQQRVLRIELLRESGGRGERMQNRLIVELQ